MQHFSKRDTRTLGPHRVCLLALMGFEFSRRVWPIIAAFIWATAVGAACRALTRDSTGVAALWLVNGFVLALMLTSAKSRRYQILVGAFAGIAASAGIVGDSLAIALSGAGMNVAEIWLAGLAVNWMQLTGRDLAQPRVVLRFVGLCAIFAPAVSALLASLSAVALGYAPISALAWSWFLSHALGMLCMAPASMVVFGPDLGRLLRRDRLAETMLLSAFTIALTALVFWQTTVSLVFLVATPLLLVAFRGGVAGVSLAVLATVAIAVPLTLAGKGPFGAIPNSSLTHRIHLLQFFIAWLLANTIPVVIAVSQQRRAYRAVDKLRDRLRLLTDYSSDVIVLTDLTGRRLFVSPSVKQVLGWEPAVFLASTFREFTDPETVNSIQMQLTELAADKGRTTIGFRARRSDGAPLWIDAHIQYFKDKGFIHFETDRDEVREIEPRAVGDEGFVVVLRDVTRRREAELALMNANKALEALAWTDGLTGLGNRRRFDQALEDEWTQALVSGLPVAVIMLDVDNFKAFNDTYGHQGGDQCLAAVGLAIATASKRSTDIACRYGGEEFALVLPNTSVENAMIVADRIRRSIEDRQIPHKSSSFGTVTVSVGVAGWVPQRRGEQNTVVAQADAALYSCKARGRNCVGASPALAAA
jgi:diguanylate cyclase (GGDEF)-like protein/PAS domain S-box-containing protein